MLSIVLSTAAFAQFKSDTLSVNVTDVVKKLRERELDQHAKLKRYSFEQKRTIEVQRTGMKAEARYEITYTAPDQWGFKRIAGSGHEALLATLDQAVEKSLVRRRSQQVQYQEVDYDFSFLGVEWIGRFQCYLLALTPKRQDKRLRKGRIWVDSKEFAVLRFEGQAATLSPTISSSEILEESTRMNGFWFTHFVYTKSESLMMGKIIITAENTNFRIQKD
jgi:hypothetical protein